MKGGKKIAGILIFLIVLLQLSNHTYGQVTVNIKMDTSMLLIGDQTNVTFQATFPDSINVNMPIFSDTIIDKLEILNISEIDTINENNIIKLKQEYLVTSFDSGWYAIPPIDFTINFPKANRIDTLQSLPIYFGVTTMALDTANTNAITDIKAPIGAPITFKEILPYAGVGIGILLLAFIMYILYIKFIKKETIFVKKEKPKEPAHIIAYRDLEKLKQDMLWQKGLIKEFYSRLTDVIRIYIENRFGILAMESTTDEIIDAFRTNSDIDKDLKDGLFDTLVRADFVKFAKASTLPNENEQSFSFAYKFIEKTKPVEILIDKNENNTNNTLTIKNGKHSIS